MSELMKAPLGTEMRVELGREDERVSDVDTAGVVTHEQRRTTLWNIVKAANLGAEVVTQDGTPEREHTTDVVRVPRVDVVSVERPPRVDQIADGHPAPGRRPIDRGAPGAKCRSQQ